MKIEALLVFGKRKRESLTTAPFLKYTIIYKTTIFLYHERASFTQRFSYEFFSTLQIYILFFKKTNILPKKYHFFLIFSMNLMFLLAIYLFFITNG